MPSESTGRRRWSLSRWWCSECGSAGPGGGDFMGKRGVERPHVVGTRLNGYELALLDNLRGSRTVTEYLRHLIRHAKHCQKC